MRGHLFFAGAALTLADTGAGWRQDPQHPKLEYQVSCNKGALSILWRNDYPGAVSLSARVKSETYDGVEQAQIPPGQTFKSDPDTMSCSLGTLTVRVLKFSMAPAPPPPPATKDKEHAAPKEAIAPPAVVATLLRFDPNAEKMPEIAAGKLAQISSGMKQDDVLARLGPPASKIAMQNDGEYVETYQYRLPENQIAIVHFTNGIVTGIAPPKE